MSFSISAVRPSPSLRLIFVRIWFLALYIMCVSPPLESQVIPAITVTPNAIAAGSADSVLTVNFNISGFPSGAQVRWTDSTGAVTFLATTFVSASRLTAVLKAGLVGSPGTASISVMVGGGEFPTITNSVPFTINGPSIQSLSPASAAAGGPAFTLTVNGTNFSPASIVEWNAHIRGTTFVNSTQLTASIPATDIATAGTASVGVGLLIFLGGGGGIGPPISNLISFPVAPPTTITVNTNPPGLQISIDGVTAPAPQTVSWTGGSSHIIGVVSPQGRAGTRFVFTGWSDGGVQSHTVTTPSTATTYTATFKTQYQFITTAVGPGTVTATPASPDGYYDSGASVLLTATANAGSQFQAWGGALPDPPIPNP